MNTQETQSAHDVQPLPAALQSMNPLRWLSIFGPGAIIASLTIGTGELIFSSRGGAIFGYRILFLFLVISIFKWTLVFSTARHMVLTGVHPLRRWMDLPFGPRGWLPAVMFVFAAICIPIWVSFHSSVIGDLLAGLTGTKHVLNGATVHLWGAGVLVGVLLLALAGGYATLEKAQLLIVTAMLLAVGVALILLKPDWLQLLLGAVVPRPLTYPSWLLEDSRPALQQIAARPVWVEASLYVGVIGGASYDYLAYTSFLRDKSWGLASNLPSRVKPELLSPTDLQNAQRWIRAPLIDCTLSFLVVFLFSAVFVASGWLVLSPQRQIPGDGNFLEHQAQFVTQIHPWLYPLYVIGALLTMLGTLYGTLEVAPTVLREFVRLVSPESQPKEESQRLRRFALFWCALGAAAVLLVSFGYQVRSGNARPPGITKLLIPANLFTGVLSCGFICLLNPWMDRVLPRQLRQSVLLNLLNFVAGFVFVALGLKGYWDFGGWSALAILFLTIGVGFLVAVACRRFVRLTAPH
jgi:hypothetical protein